MKQYLPRLIERDSKRVIAEYECVALAEDVFDRFMAACDAATAPNQKLREARKLVHKG